MSRGMCGITLMSTQAGQGTQFLEINLAGDGGSDCVLLKDGLPRSEVLGQTLFSDSRSRCVHSSCHCWQRLLLRKLPVSIDLHSGKCTEQRQPSRRTRRSQNARSVPGMTHTPKPTLLLRSFRRATRSASSLELAGRKDHASATLKPQAQSATRRFAYKMGHSEYATCKV